eukprot:TRINITY_DN1254_c0_g1_i1.p1 TRINITY_DN1254_c0_g1~~TRINITY_DN1254_c0_g1_i1.p1  ORF type:complete len:233 (-),score=62.08 TRINITY_DN1254_c0_g1_i1:38-736(-)
MKWSLALLVVLSCACVASCDKPTWPDEFAMPFGLNFAIGIHNASAMMYYNWDQAKSQLLDYTSHCFPLLRYNSGFHPCKMYFNPKGIFASIPSLNIPCCTFVANVGAVPPTFLQGFNYTGVNQTVPDMYGKMHDTMVWQGADDFKYWTDASAAHYGDDVQFQDGPTTVTWNFGEMSVTPQNPSLFDLPSSTCDAKCSTGSMVADKMADLWDTESFPDPWVVLALAVDKMMKN